MSGVSTWSSKTLGWISALAGIAGSVWFLAYIGYKPGPELEGHWTRWLPTIELATLGVVAMLASLISLRNRIWAAILVLISSATTFLLCAGGFNQYPRSGEFLRERSHGQWLDVLWLVSSVMLVLGLYWLFTRGSQPTLVGPVRVFWQITGIILLLALVPAGSVLMSICFDERWFRDLCNADTPFTTQRDSHQTVFTARALRGFRSPRLQAGMLDERGALFHVEKAFWGVPRWYRGLAVVVVPSPNWGAFNPFVAGQRYFVDADRLDGSLTRFLPIFRDHLCSRSAPIQDAEIELRVLRDGLPTNGLRILGQTVRVQMEKDSNYSYRERVPRLNVTIEACARGERFSAVSDQYGVFDVSGLPLGCYGVGNTDESGEMHWNRYCCNPTQGPKHSICECTVFVK